MLRQTELMQVSDVRGIVSHLVREELVSQAVVENARDTVLAMLQQGAENGLTPAEIIRAALAPVFEKRRGCDCPTCGARRAARASDTRFGGTIHTRSSLASN